jgi:hypothetical protein
MCKLRIDEILLSDDSDKFLHLFEFEYKLPSLTPEDRERLKQVVADAGMSEDMAYKF